MTDRVAVDQLRQSADLFYQLRDQRTREGNPYVSDSTSANICIKIDEAASNTVNGQIILFTVLNTLLRMGRHFARPYIYIPERVPMLVKVVPGWNRELNTGARQLASQIDPHSELRPLDGSYSSAICIGEGSVSADRLIHIGVLDDKAMMSKSPVRTSGATNVLAASAAAYAGVAELYKYTFASRLGKRELAELLISFEHIPDADLGNILVVGAGGIGHALAWLLQFFTCSAGRIDIVDFEEIEISNLNRYFCAGVANLYQSKSKMLCEYIREHTEFMSAAFEGDYGMLVRKGIVDVNTYDKVVTCLDSVEARLEVQSDFPRLLLNAGTNAYSFQASMHDFVTDACLGCLFPPRAGINHGVRIPCDQRPGGSPHISNESYSFVTGLAGVYLALQILGRAASRHLQGSALALDNIIEEPRRKDPQCALYCNEQIVQDAFRLRV